MKKGVLLILFTIIVSYTAKAQLVSTSIGLTGGGIATQMEISDYPQSTPMYISGYGGLYANINIGTLLGVKGGANYSIQGANLLIEDLRVNLNQHYLNVPVALMVNLRSFVSLELGFFQNILLMSNLVEKGMNEVTLSPDEGALKYNFGAFAGLTLNVGRAMFFEFKYNYGLSKSYATMGQGFPANTITAGIGFNIVSIKRRIF